MQTCPSPDSTEGRTTPKFYISKLYTNNTNSSCSLSSSPSAAASPNSASAMEMQIDIPNSIISSTSNNTDSNNSSGIFSIEPISTPSVNQPSEVINSNNSSMHESDRLDDSKIEKIIKDEEAILINPEILNKDKKMYFDRITTDNADDNAISQQQLTESVLMEKQEKNVIEKMEADVGMIIQNELLLKDHTHSLIDTMKSNLMPNKNNIGSDNNSNSNNGSTDAGDINFIKTIEDVTSLCVSDTNTINDGN